jgi:hypothetical protein
MFKGDTDIFAHLIIPLTCDCNAHFYLRPNNRDDAIRNFAIQNKWLCIVRFAVISMEFDVEAIELCDAIVSRQAWPSCPA